MGMLIRMLSNYLNIGLMIFAVSIFCTFVGYYVVYKKILKGKCDLSLQKILLIVLAVIYVCAVVGVVFFIREEGIVSKVELNLFSEYKEAISTFNMNNWGYLILNIALFVPLGIILPLLFDKFKSIWKTSIVALIVTLIIETAQLITQRGIFSADDIFNNILGALIGCGFILFVITIRKKTQYKVIKLVAYLAPLAATVLVFSIIFISYNMQEFGNLQSYHSVAYIESIMNKSLTDITKINSTRGSAEVYGTKVGTHKDADELAEKIFGLNHETISDKYVYSKSTFYRSNKGNSLNIIYLGLIYAYSTLSEDTIMTLDESFVRNSLNKFGIDIIDGMEYSSNSYGEYIFKANMLSAGNSLYNGEVICTFDKDKAIEKLINSMMYFTPVKSHEIISSQEAFDLAKKEYYFFDYNGETFEAEAFSIEYYSLDTKGFLQPFYVFYDYKDENILTIVIPALVK